MEPNVETIAFPQPTPSGIRKCMSPVALSVLIENNRRWRRDRHATTWDRMMRSPLPQPQRLMKSVQCIVNTEHTDCRVTIWYAFSAIDFFVRCRRCLIDVKRWREMKTNVSILITMNTDGCVFDFPFIRRALPNPSNNCQCLCSQPILTSVIFAILCLSAYVERKALAFFLFNPISVAAFSASNNILEVVVRCVAGVQCEPPRFMQNWHWQWRSSCARVE